MKTPSRKRPVRYYIPHHMHWSLAGGFGLFFIAIGAIEILHTNNWGWLFLSLGFVSLSSMLWAWFHEQIVENNAHLHSHRLERSYRIGMLWFIFSEIMFFGVFFSALFYARLIVLPQLGNATSVTHQFLWPNFSAHWPLLETPNPTLFPAPSEVINTWGIPAFNTFLLLSSAVTVTWAHWGLQKEKPAQVIKGLIMTIILGLIFLGCQIYEYTLANEHYGLSLHAGIYGTTFFMLTGFHGLHVMLGLLMLSVILYRSIKGDFSVKHQFAFEASTWYWHFVDVVWLFLFVFVYWL